MTKKTKSNVEQFATVSFNTPFTELSGEVLGIEDGMITILHKKPRSSKMLRTTVPLSKTLYYNAEAGLVVYRSDSTVYDEVLVTSSTINENGFVELETAVGTICVLASLVVLSGNEVSDAEPAEPAKKTAPSKPAAPAVKGKPPVPGKKAAKSADDSDDADWE